MKSELLVVRGLAAAIFDDLCLMHPSIELSLRRDLSRLHKADSISGLPVYTITLPSLSKFLERSLDEMGLLVKRPPFLGAKSKTDRRPTFLYGLWCMIFEPDGTLRRDARIDAIDSLRQVFLFAKKLRIDCEERYKENALLQFREIEKSLPASWDNTWDHDDPSWSHRFGHPLWGNRLRDDCELDLFESTPMHEYDLDLDWTGFRSFAARIVAQFGSVDVYGIRHNRLSGHTGNISRYDRDDYMLRPKHGPGAISDKGNHTKYDHRYWTHRLEAVFPYDFFGAPNSGFAEDVIFREFPSQLHAVPKTQSGPRLIAAEPTAHQWMQGAMQIWLEDACNRTILRECIDFRSQFASREMARKASQTGEYATVDLSSASDRLTTRLVEYCFQSNRSLLDALHACRTRAVLLSKDDKSDLILLRKFATQGSAVTFPVQTIVYTLLALWAVALTSTDRKYESIASLASQVRVFGDDIIVPVNAYPVLRRILSSVRLVVNESKSFSQGKFRESCGMDAYDGEDVTPAYFRQVYSPAPESVDSVVQCSNNFFKKGFWRAAQYIQKTVPPQELILLPVVNVRSGALGLSSFVGDYYGHLRKRWNADLQREEFRVLALSSRPKRERGKGHGDLLQFFNEFSYKESMMDIIPYTAGEVSAPNTRKSIRWVGIDDMPECLKDHKVATL